MKNYPTEEQLQTLREGLRGHHLEAMMILALVTGIRRDELRRLTWPQVDLEKGEMHVLDSKTKCLSRLLPLPQDVVHVLRQHYLRQEEQNRDAETAKLSLDLVFPDRTGGELSSQRFLQEWYVLRAQVGLPYLRFHDLRVFVWRRLLEQGRAAREGRDNARDGSLDGDKNADEHKSSHDDSEEMEQAKCR
jgi:integrase